MLGECPTCGLMSPDHLEWCNFHPSKAGKSNPYLLLALPFAAMAVPFVVVLFPLASAIAIVVATTIFRAVGGGIHGSSVFWWTFFIAIIPFLLALMAEQRAERFRGYRVARHVLRVIGVPWLAAQYIIYGPGLIGSEFHRASFSLPHFLGQLFSRPGVLVTAIVLMVLTHFVGLRFDLSGRRQGSIMDLLGPSDPLQAGRRRAGPGMLQTGALPFMARDKAAGPLSLSRKLLYATGLAFAVGVVATMLSKDYDSAVLVILRVGLLCAVVFCAAVAAHHLLTRRSRALR